MTLSRHPQLSEELLSAYLDNEVTDEERALIESIMATDPAVAWEVESLRQTVQLVQALPPLALPRSFAIDAIVVERAVAAPIPVPAAAPIAAATVRKRAYAEPEISWWQSFLQAWQGGNLYLRNAAALAFTLLVVFFASDQFVAPYQQPSATRSNQEVAQFATSAPTLLPETSAAVASNEAAAATTDKAGKLVVPENAENAELTTEEAVVADAASSDNAAAALAAPTTLLPYAQRAPQEDTLDMTGGGGMGDSSARLAPGQGGGSTAYGMAMDSGNPAGNAPASPVEQPTAPPAATSSITDSAQLATPTAELEAVSAAEVSLTDLATVTASAVETVTITPLAAQPTAILVDESTDATNTIGGSDTERWLGWAQLVSILCTVVLGTLWWRSKG